MTGAVIPGQNGLSQKRSFAVISLSLASTFRRLRYQLPALANRLLPSRCLLCHETLLDGALFCSGCELALPHLPGRGPLCESCALPLTGDGSFCGQCLHRPPPFDSSLIPYRYSYPLDHLLHRFKYRRQLHCGRLLGQLLADYIRQQGDPLPDLLVPVPLHWSRRLLRGFNQADMLARHLGRTLDLPVHTRLCRRRQRTPAQQGLSRQQRQRNLRQAFNLAPAAAAIIEHRHIALVDDVVTTTATVRQISRLLLAGGAARVEVWALARTPDYSSLDPNDAKCATMHCHNAHY